MGATRCRPCAIAPPPFRRENFAADLSNDMTPITPITPITTTGALGDACGRLARHPFVTVDTEFLRESTYFPRLCVLQMASTDNAVVVDALADGIELAPFLELMANKQVMKVFHAARQDVEIVW